MGHDDPETCFVPTAPCATSYQGSHRVGSSRRVTATAFCASGRVRPQLQRPATEATGLTRAQVGRFPVRTRGVGEATQ